MESRPSIIHESTEEPNFCIMEHTLHGLMCSAVPRKAGCDWYYDIGHVGRVLDSWAHFDGLYMGLLVVD